MEQETYIEDGTSVEGGQGIYIAGTLMIRLVEITPSGKLGTISEGVSFAAAYNGTLEMYRRITEPFPVARFCLGKRLLFSKMLKSKLEIIHAEDSPFPKQEGSFIALSAINLLDQKRYHLEASLLPTSSDSIITSSPVNASTPLDTLWSELVREIINNQTGPPLATNNRIDDHAIFHEVRVRIRARAAASDSTAWAKAIANTANSKSSGITALMYACSWGLTAAIEELLQDPEVIESINQCDESGWTAFMYACRCGNGFNEVSNATLTFREVLLKLLNAGANPHETDALGNNSLGHACLAGALQAARWLHEEAGLLLGFRDNEGKTLKMMACCNGHLEVLIWLAERGEYIYDWHDNGLTLLMFACLFGQMHTVEWLLSHCPNIGPSSFLVLYINSTDSSGCTALMYACMSGSLPIVTLLCEQNDTSIHTKNVFGSTAIMWACHLKHIHIARWLFRMRGAEIDVQDLLTLGVFIVTIANCRAAVAFLPKSGFSSRVSLILRTSALTEIDEQTGDEIVARITYAQSLKNAAVDQVLLEDPGLCQLLMVPNLMNVTVLENLIRSGRYTTILSESLINVVDSFQQRVPIDRIRLHLCGSGGAGKTTLKYTLEGNKMKQEELKSSRYSDTRTKRVAINDSLRVTDGFIYGFRDIFKLCVFDHGGQQEFHVTYLNLFHHPMSVFIIVIPITNRPQRDKYRSKFLEKSTVASVAHQLRYWLSCLGSLLHPVGSRLLVLLNCFGEYSQEYLEPFVNSCTKLIEDFSQNCPELHSKFISLTPFVMNCASNRWSLLRTELVQAFNSLIAMDFTLPKLCMQLINLIDSYKSRTGRMVEKISNWYAFLKHQQNVLGLLSEGALDALMGYLELRGHVILMNDTSLETTRDSGSKLRLVVLDPHTFFSAVIGSLFNYEHAHCEPNMIQSASTIKKKIRESVTRINVSVSEEIEALLPELLHWMRLCSPIRNNLDSVTDDTTEYWLMSFMEHHAFDEGGLGEGRDLPELRSDSFWKELNFYPSSKQCSGRLVSLVDLLDSNDNDSDSFQSWLSFLPGSFARFQIQIADAFWAISNDSRKLHTLSAAPFWINLRYEGMDGSKAEMFAQMMLHSNGGNTDAFASQVLPPSLKVPYCCRVWVLGTSDMALSNLLEEGFVNDTMEPMIDVVLNQFVKWFHSACSMNDRGPHLYSYCIHPSCMTKRHDETIQFASEQSRYYFPLEAVREAFQDNPNDIQARTRLIGWPAEPSDTERILEGVRANRNILYANNQLISAQIRDGIGIPRLFILLPVKKKFSAVEIIRSMLKPFRWVTTEYRLFFVCPVRSEVCCTNMNENTGQAEGFPLHFPRGWVNSRYGLAVRYSLQVLCLLADPVAGHFGVPNALKYLQDEINAALDHTALNSFVCEIDSSLLTAERQDIDRNPVLLHSMLDRNTEESYRALKIFHR